RKTGGHFSGTCANARRLTQGISTELEQRAAIWLRARNLVRGARPGSLPHFAAPCPLPNLFPLSRVQTCRDTGVVPDTRACARSRHADIAQPPDGGTASSLAEPR